MLRGSRIEQSTAFVNNQTQNLPANSDCSNNRNSCLVAYLQIASSDRLPYLVMADRGFAFWPSKGSGGEGAILGTAACEVGFDTPLRFGGPSSQQCPVLATSGFSCELGGQACVCRVGFSDY